MQGPPPLYYCEQEDGSLVQVADLGPGWSPLAVPIERGSDLEQWIQEVGFKVPRERWLEDS